MQNLSHMNIWEVRLSSPCAFRSIFICERFVNFIIHNYSFCCIYHHFGSKLSPILLHSRGVCWYHIHYLDNMYVVVVSTPQLNCHEGVGGGGVTKIVFAFIAFSKNDENF